jgi:hypothetical protein
MTDPGKQRERRLIIAVCVVLACLAAAVLSIVLWPMYWYLLAESMESTGKQMQAPDNSSVLIASFFSSHACDVEQWLGQDRVVPGHRI